MRRAAAAAIATLVGLAAAAPAFACGGLVAPNGSVNLLRTSTLAGYHNGVEHYITSFEFKGGGAKFGSIVPLPGKPKKVTRGGKWTLQRLEKETQPPPPQPVGAEDGGGKDAEEVYETKIGGLLITILKGGSKAVGRWAEKEGFGLSPDAPEVLHFYSQRSKFFMAARFIPKSAKKKKLKKGDGVPIHLRIPTDNPWVPLRILALGKKGKQLITADVYLLTDDEPAMLPAPGDKSGFVLQRSERRVAIVDRRPALGPRYGMDAEGPHVAHVLAGQQQGTQAHLRPRDRCERQRPTLRGRRLRQEPQRPSFGRHPLGAVAVDGVPGHGSRVHPAIGKGLCAGVDLMALRLPT